MYYMNYDDPLSDIDLESNSSGFEEIAWSSDYVEDDSDIASLSGFSENEVESDVEGNPDDPDYYCSASPYTFRFEQLNLPSLMGVLAQQDNLNVFVEGKVGSGKTTFLNTLCQLLEGDFKKRTDMINVMPYFVIKTNYSKHFSHTYCWQKRALKNLMKSVSRRSKLIQIYENSVDMKQIIDWFFMQNYTTSTQYEKLMRMNDKLKEMIHEQNNLIIYISATARKRYENYRTDSRSMIFNMFNFHQKYFNEFPDTRGQILTVNGNVSKLELEQYAHETANFLNRFRSLKLGLK